VAPWLLLDYAHDGRPSAAVCGLACANVDEVLAKIAEALRRAQGAGARRVTLTARVPGAFQSPAQGPRFRWTPAGGPSAEQTDAIRRELTHAPVALTFEAEPPAGA
jgi:hypothetical protein